MTKQQAAFTLWTYGRDILRSPGMAQSREYRQHGSSNVYAHSVSVACACLRVASALHLRVDNAALVRGALLHDYFLYDWHVKDRSHALHGPRHALRALRNAERDFELGTVERDMIFCHMFPLNFRVPRFRESWILTSVDKYCAVRERLRRKKSPGETPPER